MSDSMHGSHANPSNAGDNGVKAPLVAADGRPLKVSLRRALFKNKLRAILLVAPLMLFLLVAFILPIFSMLTRSVESNEVRTILPTTALAIQAWEGDGLPDEQVFAALAYDLQEGQRNRNLGRVASRLNYEFSGMRSTITGTARRISNIDSPDSWKETLMEAHRNWGNPDVWTVIKRESRGYTLSYYLAALDMRFDTDGSIVRQPESRRVYVDLMIKTLWMSILITFLCFLLGYPVAFLLASLPMRTSSLLMMLVLLPFWTSLLVRTTTWIAILQSQGILNNMLVALGIIDDQARLRMIYNEIGTIVAMTHILLPFMILPLYSVMKSISPSYMRAARSMGATGFTAFRRVYFPQTVPGIGAGAILVFILAIGYYITPALVGGESGRFITNFIAYHMQVSLNWGLAAAIASILLGLVITLYLIYNKLVGSDSLKLG